MKKSRTSGVLFFVLASALSLSTALNVYGTWVEQAIAFSAQFMTFFILIALYCKWRDIEIFSDNAILTIAISYPIIVIVKPLYMMFEYSDQTMPSSLFLTQGLEFWLSVFVATVLLKKEKR